MGRSSVTRLVKVSRISLNDTVMSATIVSLPSIFNLEPWQVDTARTIFLIIAAIYVGTAITALTMLMSGLGSGSAGGSSGGGTEDQAAATVMSWPGGQWLVGIGGLLIIAFAVYQFYKHTWRKKFMERLGAMDSDVRRAVERAGQAGYAARAIVAVIAGGFLVVAAIQHDPQEAVGLSGALGSLSGETWGQVLLWIIAIGLVLYGAFAFAEAKYRRAT